MKIGLLIRALVKFFSGAAIVFMLLFLSAGTLRYQNGWLLMIVLFIPMFLAGLVMLVKAPERLENRLQAKEKREVQNGIVKLSGLMFVVGFVMAGLDHRFGWTLLPVWVSRAASVLFLLGYLLYAEVLRENPYLSRTIEVRKDQKVVDTGLYGIVRHPMYAATVVLFLSVPLVLGSLISLAVFLLYPVLIVKRITEEERVLAKELEGYGAYRKKVPYRLLPFIW